MNNDLKQAIQHLLGKSRICFLATQGKYGAESSMAPYAIYQGHILLHLSSLARHTKNIHHDASIGLMICSPEIEGQSPLALPRLSFQGVVSEVASSSIVEARQSYLEAIPDAKSLFSFLDFQLLQMSPVHIQWIGGFGQTRKISTIHWNQLFNDGTEER